MPVMSQKTATYTYELAELTKLIANDLNVSIEAVGVRFNLHDSSDDRLDRSASYSVRDVTVTVDMKQLDESQIRSLYPGR